MVELVTAEVSLLAAMMTTSGAIWALGFVAYVFMWNYLERWTGRREKRDPTWKPDKNDCRSLKDNLFSFRGFLIDGSFALGTIAIAALTLAYDYPLLIPIASAFYALTLGTFMLLFANEIRHSIQWVKTLLRRT